MDELRRIADAVLYEGYLLWPYRRSALKNQRRFMFGGVYPPAHAAAHPDDPCTMRTEVLLEGGDPAAVDVTVRFLQVVRCADHEEAVEREVGPGPIAIAAGSEDGRAWEALEGAVDVTVVPVSDGVHRIAVAIANRTPWAGGAREAVPAVMFCSTHTILHTTAGAFVSATDPPAALEDAVAACRNQGTWPVLVGEPGTRATVLSSPIILEDHPRIAPESPGDLFDAGEIDGMLVLNILALTDDEKAEMRSTDPRAAAILDRTEALSREQLLTLLDGRLQR
jgi:hypothetical protein